MLHFSALIIIHKFERNVAKIMNYKTETREEKEKKRINLNCLTACSATIISIYNRLGIGLMGIHSIGKILSDVWNGVLNI